MNNPTPGRIVLYHFSGLGDDHKVERHTRPAIVTSVGASDNVVNLYVFFEPGDLSDPYRPPAINQFVVGPFDLNNPQDHRWSWPPRV